MSKATIARIAPPQKNTTAPPFPGNYIGLEWTQSENVKELAYGLRVHSTLAMLAYKGLQAHQAEAGIPRDDVYALVEALSAPGRRARFLRGLLGGVLVEHLLSGRDPLMNFDVFEVARQVGAVKTFNKPFKFEDLIAAVRELTEGQGADRA